MFKVNKVNTVNKDPSRNCITAS